ncbi:MAG: CAP domain-containing protein [Myxococcales bacterium FL481]|nr:MAG: CAP domain-containing protein [Myxococcales bacterium FL481]
MGDHVPDNAYCEPVSDWSAERMELEQEVLAIVNQRRAEGANCGSAGDFDPAGPLRMQGRLRCAARAHSLDMAERDYFDHYDPEGDGPSERLAAAGYQGRTWGENIAGGNATAAATMQQWMDSDGHCANVMNPQFTELGVGYVPGGQWGHLWTQAFGG